MTQSPLVWCRIIDLWIFRVQPRYTHGVGGIEIDYQNLYELRDYTPGLYLSSWPYIFAVL